MANRSYLYSLSNRPAGYADRPETISGLAEWPYDVPFMFRLLMSGDPQLCGSLVSDGFDDDTPERKTRLHAISSGFDAGFERVKRFVAIVRRLAEAPPGPAAAPPSAVRRLRQWFGGGAPAAQAAPASYTRLIEALDETLAFLEAHRDSHLLLETIELDCMSENEESALRSLVEQEIARCRQAGAAVDALPADIGEAGRLLMAATAAQAAPPLDAFFGLRLDDDCDNLRDAKTERPLGLVWSDVLYFDLMNRADFEASP